MNNNVLTQTAGDKITLSEQLAQYCRKLLRTGFVNLISILKNYLHYSCRTKVVEETNFEEKCNQIMVLSHYSFIFLFVSLGPFYLS